MTATTATRRHLLSTSATLAALVVVVVVVALAGRAAAGHHNDCETAQLAFGDCVTYVVGAEATVSPRCCTGLADLAAMGSTAPQRRTLCGCVLEELNAAGAVQPGRAAALAAACAVRVGFIPTSHDFNCATFHEENIVYEGKE
ncbi:hypothetical protein ACP4OV_030616 [Aristida adscensionis]